MRSFKLWWPLFSGWLVLTFCLLLPQSTAGDCDPRRYTYHFIDPVIVGQSTSIVPFFLRFEDLYEDYFREPGAVQQQSNIQEWYDRFCGLAKAADIQYIVYDATIGQLENLERLIVYSKSPLRDLGGRMAQNSFARHLVRHECLETIRYLMYAKRCEPYVIRQNPWDRRPQAERVMRNLLTDGQRAFDQTESFYIRLRYAYQLIRLAHYLKDYDQVLFLYQDLLPKIDADPSIVDWWIEGHRAGALMALGQSVQANYLYSRIFENSPAKRESAWRSFRVETDEEWEECLLLCKNDHERAVMHLLRAQEVDTRLLEEMRAIYNLDPQEKALEILLVREVQQLEADLLGLESNPARRTNRVYHDVPRPGAAQRIVDLQAFAREVLQEGLVARPELWQLALGYLETIAGDYYYAKQTFEEVRTEINNDTLEQQLAVFDVVLEILSLDSVSTGAERRFFSLTRQERLLDRYPDIDNLLRDQLVQIYDRSGADGKAFLLRHDFDLLKPNLQIELINELLVLAENDLRTRFEDDLIDKIGSSQQDAINRLLDLKATYYLAEMDINAAYSNFRQIPRENWNDFGLYSPYIQRLNDCVHCPIPSSAERLNKGEMIEDIVGLEEQVLIESSRELSAQLFFQLGLAYYNLSYFGPNWRGADYFRSGTSAQRVLRNRGREEFDYPGFPNGNREVFDCSKARFYFERARALSSDPEVSARAAFWAAKCERNEWYTDGPANVDPSYINFQLLASNYADTDFYQRAIQECSYFRAFVRRRYE